MLRFIFIIISLFFFGATYIQSQPLLLSLSTAHTFADWSMSMILFLLGVVFALFAVKVD